MDLQSWEGQPSVTGVVRQLLIHIPRQAAGVCEKTGLGRRGFSASRMCTKSSADQMRAAHLLGKDAANQEAAERNQPFCRTKQQPMQGPDHG